MQLAALCEACDRKEPYIASEWFSHVWFLHALQQAGYPFAANDLTLDEWLALGVLNGELDAMKAGVYGK